MGALLHLRDEAQVGTLMHRHTNCCLRYGSGLGGAGENDMIMIAGNLAGKKIAPATAGTFPVTTPLFTVLLTGVIVIVGALTFFPVLSLGPVLEHLLMRAGQLF